MGWGFDCLCWPCGRAFDQSCSPGGGDIWIFLCPTWGWIWLPTRTKETETEYMFPHFHASRTRHAVWKDLETMEANENKVKVSGFYCIDQLDPYRYCGIKVNGSKEKPSRFCKYNWSVWGWHSPQSRYKAYKTDFLCILLLRTIYSNLQNVDFLLKVSVFYAVY